MADPSKRDLGDDRVERSSGGGIDDSSSVSSGVETSSVGSGNVAPGRTEFGLTERLTDILVDEGDGDLLLQHSDREDRLLLWLQALDMQVMGACRADERLKPLLKMNASNGMAEDRLLAHLSQHFEPAEVGMLARCFCIPLVSIRVGKIIRQGTLFCPTTARGNLCLTVLPTSDLRLSFIGDDGNTERLVTISSKARNPTITVDEISADSSGRSFHIKIGNNRDFYFWCSEKSKLLGLELLSKMKDILGRRPSIAELTGISKSRLVCFATHLRAYLVGSNSRENSIYFPASSSDFTPCFSDMSPSLSSKPLRSRCIGNQSVKSSSSYQGSLSPRSSSFKECHPRSLRNAAREKSRRRATDNLVITLPNDNDSSSSNESKSEKQASTETSPVSPSSAIESLGNLSLSPTPSAVSSSPPFMPPYYCWYPKDSSSMQYPSGSSQLATSSIECPLLPPLSSLLSGSMAPMPPLSLGDVPSYNFPLLPDPLVRLPISGSQQIPTFTPLICDPIVHIPVIDVCSSGQGYLVSAGPAISSTIPPLHPKLGNPLIPDAESVVEKGARETLRLLLSSSTETNSQLMGVLPAVLANSDKQGMHATGSRGLYTGTSDVNAIVSSMATIGLVSLAKGSSEAAENLVCTEGSCSGKKDTGYPKVEEGSDC